MEQINKSLEALNRAFARLGKDGVDEIINKIESIKVDSPTIEEYFSEFETHYDHLLEELYGFSSSNKQSNNLVRVENIPPPQKIKEKIEYLQIWRDVPKNELNQNKSTTEQNSGGFLFSLRYGEITTCKIQSKRL